MAATTTIQKLTHNEANVKFYSASAQASAALALATDLKLASETVDTPVVNIDKILWTTSPVSGAYITITRNATIVAALYGTGEMNLNALGMTEDQLNTDNITVTFVGTGGTCYLKLKKTTGYGD